MTTLDPFARLVRLTDNAVLATTRHLLKGSISRVLDKPGARSLAVPLGDAGDGTSDPSGFANALIAAVGGAAVGGTPVPTLLQVSFDGGATVDAQWMVEKVVPDLDTGQLLITCDGDDSGTLYQTIGPDRFPGRDIALADLLGGARNAIIPLDAAHYGISTSGTIPGLQGLLLQKPGSAPGATPGSPMWATGAQNLVAMTGVVSNALSSAIAFLGVNIDSLEDSVGRIITSLVKILGGVVFSADSQDQGSRGHAVWCDADVNLAGDIEGVVCDGTPTIGSPAGTFGYSNNVATRGGSGATGTPTLSGGAVTGLTGGGGSAYVVPPLVAITGDGFGAEAEAFVSGGAVSGYRMVNQGQNYTTATATLTSRAAVPRALVIGNVGGNPAGHAFTFDGTSSLPLAPGDEQTTARLFTDKTSLQPDLSPLYSEIRLVGGTNDAGLLPSETITSIITLNNTPVEMAAPYVSWQNVLPIIGTNLNDKTGCVYMDVGDGRLRRVPSWTLAAPVYDLQVNNVNNVIYAATSQGVFSHATTNLATSTTLWTRVGGLTFPVRELRGLVDTTFYLYALVQGVGQQQDGVYHYSAASPTTQSATVGYAQWTRLHSQAKIVSIAPVSGHELFYLTQADSQAALHLYDASISGMQPTPWTFGAGIAGARVDRVLTAAGQDSVWVATSGGTQPGYYLLHAADWTSRSLQPIDKVPGTAGSALDAAVGVATGLTVEPQINRAVSLGYGIGAKSDGTNPVTVAVMLCTQVGVYYMSGTIPATGGVHWSPAANGLNGLAGLSIINLVAGTPTNIPNPYFDDMPSTAYITATRLYAISGTVFMYSYSDSRYWRDLLREPLTLGPYIFDQVNQATADLPSWAVVTIGPMASSPISGTTGSHIQIANILPSGWYWRRRWNVCYEPYWCIENSAIAFPQTYEDAITEVAVTPSVDFLRASTDLALFFIVLLGERSTKQVALTLESSFTQQESGLRFLWSTHQVAVKQTGTIAMLSSDGTHLIDTTFIDLTGAETLYVLEHQISWDGPLFTTRTTVAPSVKGPPQTGQELAAALVSDLRRIRNKGLRSKRQ